MGTDAFIMQFLSTIPATVPVTVSFVKPFDKQKDKAKQKEITDIKPCSKNKKEITENTARGQSEQVEDSRSRCQLPEQIIEHCQKNNKKHPDTQ